MHVECFALAAVPAVRFPCQAARRHEGHGHAGTTRKGLFTKKSREEGSTKKRGRLPEKTLGAQCWSFVGICKQTSNSWETSTSVSTLPVLLFGCSPFGTDADLDQLLCCHSSVISVSSVYGSGSKSSNDRQLLIRAYSGALHGGYGTCLACRAYSEKPPGVKNWLNIEK